MESRIVRWFLNPVIGTESSLFKESHISQWTSWFKDRFLPGSMASSLKKLSSARYLLAVTLFACLFVPRLSLDSLISFYRIELRTEDFLLLVIAALVFFLTPRNLSMTEVPRIEKNFLGFLLAAQLSILSGLFFRTIDKPFMSFLYLLKWMEYFLVFVLACRLTAGEKEAHYFLKAFFLLGMALACFGYWEHFFPAAKAVYPNYYRLFERPPFHGDANHVGGLLVFWIGFAAGLFLKAKTRREQFFFLASILFVFFPLIWTYSRKSYFALAGAFSFALLIPQHRKKILLISSLFVILGLILPTRLSERLSDLGEAFTSTDPFHSSWAGNWVMWKGSLWNFEKFPFFGSGLGSRHRLFYESQYVLVLAETGFVGFVSFAALLLSLIREIAIILQRRWHDFSDRGAALGWLIGFVGLLFHNLSCVSWTVSKIAIPFWFLTAVVLTHWRQVSFSRA